VFPDIGSTRAEDSFFLQQFLSIYDSKQGYCVKVCGWEAAHHSRSDRPSRDAPAAAKPEGRAKQNKNKNTGWSAGTRGIVQIVFDVTLVTYRSMYDDGCTTKYATSQRHSKGEG